MPTNSVRLHRFLRAPPERVYRAFLDADAIAKWLPPNGFTGKVHQMDARVGGTHRMSFTNLATGQSHSFGGEYLELVPHERIRYTDKFRRSTLTGTDAGYRVVDGGVLRNGTERRAGGPARSHSSGGLLSWLAGIACAPSEACGGGGRGVATCYESLH